MPRSASAEESAAIAAAIERFRAETTPSPGTEEDAIGPWQRAALAEGVDRHTTIEDTEGEGGVKWLS